MDQNKEEKIKQLKHFLENRKEYPGTTILASIIATVVMAIVIFIAIHVMTP